MIFLLLFLSTIIGIYYIFVSIFKPFRNYRKQGIPYVHPLKVIKYALSLIISKRILLDVLKELYNDFPNSR